MPIWRLPLFCQIPDYGKFKFDLENKKLKGVAVALTLLKTFVSSGCDESYQMPKWSGPGLKRKQSIEHHVNLLKRLRINGANSGTCPDFRGDILSVSSCTLDLWGFYEHMKWSSRHVFALDYSSFLLFQISNTVSHWMQLHEWQFEMDESDLILDGPRKRTRGYFHVLFFLPFLFGNFH